MVEPHRKPPLDFTLYFLMHSWKLVVCGPLLNTNPSFDDAHTVEVDLAQLEVSVMPRMMPDDVRTEVLLT